MNRIQFMTVTALTLLGGVTLTNKSNHHVNAVDTTTATSSSSTTSASSSSSTQNTQAAANETAQSVVSTHRMLTNHQTADVNGNVNPVALVKAREEAAAKRAAAAKKVAAAKRAAAQRATTTTQSSTTTSATNSATSTASTTTSHSGSTTNKGTFKLSFYDPASMGSSMGYGGVAANLSVFPKGTRLKITLSNGTVWYRTVNDTGGFAAANPRQLDVAMPNSQIPSAGILYATVEVLS